MHWTLCRATIACGWRRARPALEQNPLLTLLAGAISLSLPALALLAGRKVGSQLAAPLAAQESLASAFVLSLGWSAAVAGGAVAALAPGEAALGPQLRAAPLSRPTVFIALTALPAAFAGAGLLVAAGPFVLAFAASSPGGGGAGIVLLAALLAAASMGSALVEAVVAAGRGAVAGPLVLGALGGLWSLGTLGAGGGALAGPLAYAAEALRDPAAGPAEPLVALGLTTAAAWGLWAAAACGRPAERPERRSLRPILPIPATPQLAWLAASLKRYSRRRELRRAAVAVLVLTAAGGLAAHVLLPLPAPSAFYLTGGPAVFGAALVPLAAFGLDREAAWLRHSVPAPPGRAMVASSLAALGLALALVGAAVAPVGLAASVPFADWARLGAAAVFTCASALLAGALVPWRPDRLTEQLVSGAAFLSTATLLSLALATVVPRAIDYGIPELLLVAVALGLPLGAALAAGAVLASRARP